MSVQDVEQAIREYLPQTVHMSLGTSSGNVPWVCEVHFAFDEDLNLYFGSLISRRHSQEIAKNPQVAGNIVIQFSLGAKIRGVYFEGTAKMLETEAEQRQAFAYMNGRLGSPEREFIKPKSGEGDQYYKITVATYYLGDTYESKPFQKYELKWNGGAS